MVRTASQECPAWGSGAHGAFSDVRYGPKATFQGKCPNGREVPGPDSCSAAKRVLFDHLVGA